MIDALKRSNFNFGNTFVFDTVNHVCYECNDKEYSEVFTWEDGCIEIKSGYAKWLLEWAGYKPDKWRDVNYKVEYRVWRE